MPSFLQIKFFEIAVLFKILQNLNNYRSGVDKTPNSSWGKGCKLRKLSIVNI